jgi:hypothetical protein
MSDARGAAVELLAAKIDDAGWARFFRNRRAPERWAIAFGEMGFVSSMSIGPGQRDWRLNFNSFGREVRKALMRIEVPRD